MGYYGYNDEGYEMSRSININCPNEDCAKYDEDQDYDADGTFYHGTFTADVTCPACGTTFDVERELSEDDLYTGPDTLAEAWGDA